MTTAGFKTMSSTRGVFNNSTIGIPSILILWRHHEFSLENFRKGMRSRRQCRTLRVRVFDPVFCKDRMYINNDLLRRLPCASLKRHTPFNRVTFTMPTTVPSGPSSLRWKFSVTRTQQKLTVKPWQNFFLLSRMEIPIKLVAHVHDFAWPCNYSM